MIDRWNKEIDTLLVYAGLFSAILTAFNVQSYQLLTPAPPTDPVIVALERISAQLSSFSVNPPSVNSTHPAFVHQDSTPPPAPRWAIWLNALWFSSLIFSLSAASIGIMVKQWLNEYNSGLSGKSRQVARLRQLRLENLQRSRVKEIVSILPVLLQIASALFFAGLLVLLWQLNHTVAIVATVLIGALVIFSLSTIILPCFTTHWSYLSPPSRALYEITRTLRNSIILARRQLSFWILNRYYDVPVELSIEFHLWYGELGGDFLRNHALIYRACTLLVGPYDTSTSFPWRGMELAVLSQRQEELDGDMVAAAYTTSMDTNYLHHAAVCTTELTLRTTRTCFQAIRLANIAHWGEQWHHCQMWPVHPCMWSGAIISLMEVSGDDTEWPPSASTAALTESATDYLTRDSRLLRSDLPQTRLVCTDLARIIRHHSHSGARHFYSLDLASMFLNNYLPPMMRKWAEMNLGNDVRRHVASVYLEKALAGLDGAAADNSKTKGALDALECIIYCIPPPGSPDFKPDDPDYKAAEEYWEAINYLLWQLREHGQKAGLMSSELTRAIISYRDAYKSTHGPELPVFWEDNEEWLRKLKRDIDNSEQNAAASNTASTPAITELPLLPVNLDTDPVAAANKSAVSVLRASRPADYSSPAVADVDREASSETELLATLTSSSSHLHAPPSSGHPTDSSLPRA